MAKIETTITATSTGQTAGTGQFSWLGGRIAVTCYGTFASKTATLKQVISTTLSIALTTGITADNRVYYENVPAGTTLQWGTSGAAASAMSVTGVCESV